VGRAERAEATLTRAGIDYCLEAQDFVQGIFSSQRAGVAFHVLDGQVSTAQRELAAAQLRSGLIDVAVAVDVDTGRVFTDLPFEAWVAHVFDHDVAQPEWYFKSDADYWQGSASLTLAHLTRLFEDPESPLSSYSDAQLNQGFWYLVSSSASEHSFALVDEEVPLDVRRRCLRSFVSLFQKLFAVRCSDHLAHVDEPGAKPLNSICYMWWDVLALYGRPAVPERHAIDEECLAVLSDILRLPSIACQESALHGLGHWALYYPSRVPPIIHGFLESHAHLRPELSSYAQQASRGHVQ
jgi:hypothetical protein